LKNSSFTLKTSYNKTELAKSVPEKQFCAILAQILHCIFVEPQQLL